MSFWSFLAVLIAHALNMDWLEILQFIISGTIRNMLQNFAMIDLDSVLQDAKKRFEGTTNVLKRQQYKARAF